MFGGKKSWLPGGGRDPDLNEALDQIEQMQKEFDHQDKEKQLLLGDLQKLQKDNVELEKSIKTESEARAELEALKIEQDDKIKTLTAKEQELQDEVLRNATKVQRLTDLNEEMRSLIEQDRQYNDEELERIKKEYEFNQKQHDSKQVIIKNKLMKLANSIGAYISGSFTIEQIVDAIFDQSGVMRIN